MRPLGVVLSVVVGVGALSGTIWLARYSPLAEKHDPPHFAWSDGTYEAQKEILAKKVEEDAKKAEKTKKELEKNTDPRPQIADKGPYPKAKTGERVYEFGSMGVDEERRHKFHVDNRGQVPLVLAKGPTNCKCTISNISNKAVPPGGSAEVEMSWTPRETTNTFAKTATIWTNDPELPEIQFKIFGKVVRQFVVHPERNWHAGHVTDVQDGVVIGTIASGVDPNFKIVSVDSVNPHIKTTFRPLTGREKIHEGWKAGYQFTVTVDKGIAAGKIREPLKIHTTLEGNKTIDVEVTALLGPDPVSSAAGEFPRVLEFRKVAGQSRSLPARKWIQSRSARPDLRVQGEVQSPQDREGCRLRTGQHGAESRNRGRRAAGGQLRV